jgi:hypothetical protein
MNTDVSLRQRKMTLSEGCEVAEKREARMLDPFQLTLTPNDKVVIVEWRLNQRRAGKKIVKAGDLEACNDQIRSSLSDINSYMRWHPTLSAEEDPKFSEYNKLMSRLRRHGKDLQDLLIDTLTTLQTKIEAGVDKELTIFVEDENVTVPIGFAFDGRVMPPSAHPSIGDFDGFWLTRFSKIQTWLTTTDNDNDNLDEVVVDSDNFRALYAVDQQEWQDALSIIHERRSATTTDKYFRIFDIDVGCKSTWDETVEAWEEIAKFDNILFFLAHSDGVSIQLSGEKRLSYSLKNVFKKTALSSTLVIANTCMSLSGNRTGGTSILSLAARRGFAGLIGTEAEILNSYALLCGARLINDICYEKCDLGQAFERMRKDPTLFPLNLFYSCYGDSSFRLKTPLPPKKLAETEYVLC